MGIEPTLSAWKAEVLPLNYTRRWRGKDSNLRRLSRQIYSLVPLTARVPLRTHEKSFKKIKRAILLKSSHHVNHNRQGIASLF